MRVTSIKEMKDIETRTFGEFGVTESIIIENVGVRGADYIEENFLVKANYDELVVLVGRGNNGADGMAIARHLRNRGYSVRSFLVFPEDESTEELKRQLFMARKYGVKISTIRDAEQLQGYFANTQSGYFVLDAVLGTGTRLPISQHLFDIFNIVNESATVTVSIDIPSGITGDCGSMSGAAIKADCTMTIGNPKVGLYLYKGAKHSGEIVVLDVGFPSECEEQGDKFLLDVDQALYYYRQRDSFGHKNSFGHLLVVGGSTGMTGAVVMASTAAIRVGTGLVSSATWKDNYHELFAKMMPEVITGVIPSTEEADAILRELNDKYDAIVIGPGIGQGEWVRKSVVRLLSSFSGPIVIDADGINSLSIDDVELFSGRKTPVTFTPHIGEFARFMKLSVDEVLTASMEHMKSFVSRTNSNLILKGACTFIALTSGEIFINYLPNDGLAKAGSGDVLAGITGGFLAQAYHDVKEKRALFDVVAPHCLAVFLHARAGKLAAEAAGTRSMSATTVIEYFGKAFAELDEIIGLLVETT